MNITARKIAPNIYALRRKDEPAVPEPVRIFKYGKKQFVTVHYFGSVGQQKAFDNFRAAAEYAIYLFNRTVL